jgi:NTP pyrophosphatase (non-canonical NTP hydrolase)
VHNDDDGTRNGSYQLDSLSEIATRLRAFRRARDWEQYHSPKNLAISVAIEAGELLEHFQWRSDADVEEHLRTEEDSVAEELADVAIYVIQLAEVAGIALPEAIHAKIAQNHARYAVEVSRGSFQKRPNIHRAPGVDAQLRSAAPSQPKAQPAEMRGVAAAPSSCGVDDHQ